MVSADNLNYDVLRLIFGHLPSNDLVSVSLVSRSFLTGVTPKLFHTIFVHSKQAKKFPRMHSPFKAILLHANLAVHVRKCGITAVPDYKGLPNQQFLIECIKALALCTNLIDFYSTSRHILPPLLPTLLENARLKTMSVYAFLTPVQSKALAKYGGLCSVTLERPSWSVMNDLTGWMTSIKSSLTHLCITTSKELNNGVLESTLSALPLLVGLCVLKCPKVDHVRLLELLFHTPRLESLAFTCWVSSKTKASYSDLCNIRHLTIDTCGPSKAETPALWDAMVSSTQTLSSPLETLTLTSADTLNITHEFINSIISAHSATLRNLHLINCSIYMRSLEQIAMGCPKLEKLSIVVPVKEISSFASALKESKSLRSLVDIPELHTKHGIRPSHTTANARLLMKAIRNLHEFTSDTRRWERIRTYVAPDEIVLERFRPPPPTPWADGD